MANLTLAARRRTVLGKKVATLRRAGVTPANIYGRHVTSTAIQAPTAELDHVLRRAGRTHLITLSVDGDGEPRSVLVTDIKRQATTGRLVHVDFRQVSMQETLHVTVPIVLVGHAPIADSADVNVTQSLDILEVECRATNIPDHIEVDVSVLTDTTSTIHVRDLVVPTNVSILNDPDTSVVSVALRGPAEEEPAAATAAEEVPAVGVRSDEQAQE